MIARSLFHFTRTFDNLIRILQLSQLRASYNIEDVSDFFPSAKYVGIPMICFCDIPLKFIGKHSSMYGGFGIGLVKTWGISNKVNPILYRVNDSNINEYLKNILALALTSTVNPTSSEAFSRIAIRENVMSLTNYTKKYQMGKRENYLEREWRFIPKNSAIPILNSIAKDEKENLNNDYFKKGADFLKFKIDDISCIVVPKKQDRDNLIRRIGKFKLSQKWKLALAQLAVDLESVEKDF